jgi:predicted ATPase
MLSLAHRLHDSSLRLWAYRGLAEVSFHLGEWRAAKSYSENSAAWYDPQQRRAQTFVYGEDPAMDLLSWQSLFVLGYPDQALQKVPEALTLARELAHANSMGSAAFFATVVHIFRREPEEAREHAEALIALATEQGLPVWLAVGTIARGYALVMQSEAAAGIGQIRQGLATYRASEAKEGQTSILALLAEAYGHAGQVEEGLTVLAEALECVDRTGERFHEAELYRLRGELTLAQKSRRVGIAHQSVSIAEAVTVGCAHPTEESEAEACFLRAIEIAQKQQAKSLELRATMSLARLWQTQGKHSEAHRRLSEIYNWFTEGFDTKDLQEAKGLVEELGWTGVVS